MSSETPQGELQRFRDQAIETSINGIAFSDPHGYLTYVNSAFLRMWGYQSATEVLGRHVSSFGSSDDHTSQVMTSIVETGGWVGEAVAKKRTGEPFVVQMSGSVVRDADGAIVGTMGSFIDVTERKRAQEALRESEARYRSLVESAQDPIFTADASGRYLYVNAAAAARLGTTPEDVIGKTVDELFPPRVAEQYRDGVGRVIRTGETLVTEDLSEVRGQVAWFSTIVQPVRDDRGRIVAAQAIVRDITRLKRVEEALRESEERLRQAVRVANIGIYDHNHLTDTLYMSPQQREIVGWNQNEPAFGSDFLSPKENPRYHELIHAEDRERILSEIQRAHAGGDGVFDAEYRMVRRDGCVRWVTVRSQTFFIKKGAARHPVRTVGAVRDITEHKHDEEERAKLQSQLTQSQKMESIGRLAGGVAHDFNNMLSVIAGHAELALRQVEPTHPVRADLEQIKRAARRSAELTRQLLAFARQQTVAPKVLNLNEVVAGALDMMRRLIGEDINLVWTPGPDLWSVRIDPTQVDQVLANLSANARDAIAGVGQLTIRTENVVFDAAYCALHPEFVAGHYVSLEMTDDGRGMDAQTLSHVFEPFYTTKAEGQGTGLGLSTVYGVVKQNEGLIATRSEVGKGTTVTVFLPRFAGEAVKHWIQDLGEAPRTGTETVLLVEDEPMVLQLSKTLLERLGYTVFPASTPSEAIRLAEEHAGNIHLVLTDVVMPEMDGRELAERLLSRDPQLKKLFVSGYSASVLAPRGVLEHDVHFLQKPFSLNDLATKVRETLDA